MTLAAAIDALISNARACVVYPTETVYGVGADALNPDAVERVFSLKQRERAKPISMAVPSVAAATEYTVVSDRERAFMERFLPGPVTVLLRRRSIVPDTLVAGADRVGIRIPDHPLALELLDEVGPLTATSANLSGAGSARTVAEIDPTFREAVDCVVDNGQLPGTESTVVDPATGTIHRRGALADSIDAWLTEQSGEQ